MRDHQLGRHVAVDERAHGDAGDDPHPDLADDVLDGLDAGLDAIDDRDLLIGKLDGAGADLAHPRLEPAFELQPADDEAADDGDREAEREIGQRHLPADQREQEAERHLVDHGRGDQERERHAERNAGLTRSR